MGSYLLVVQAAGYAVSPRQFAIESAFGAHLRMLRDKMGDRFDRLVVAAPQISKQAYEQAKDVLAHIDAD